jgi:hypothetical protein
MQNGRPLHKSLSQQPQALLKIASGKKKRAREYSNTHDTDTSINKEARLHQVHWGKAQPASSEIDLPAFVSLIDRHSSSLTVAYWNVVGLPQCSNNVRTNGVPDVGHRLADT